MKRGARGVLSGLAIVFIAGAMALWVAPVRVSLPSVPRPDIPAADEDIDPSEVAEALLTFEEISRSNVFAPDRTPPRTRYVPPGSEAPEERPSTPQEAPIRLFGVAVGPDGAVALIDADARIPGAEIYRTGDRLRDYTVMDISESEVVLDGPQGRRVLNLPTSSRGSP